jgi:hypothetical protein
MHLASLHKQCKVSHATITNNYKRFQSDSSFVVLTSSSGMEDFGEDPESPAVPVGWELNSDDTKWLRFEVSSLCTEHFMRSQFPPFVIKLVQRNGTPVVRPIDQSTGHEQPICEMRVRVTVHNKWADVTSEVLPAGVAGNMALIDGHLVVKNWVFQDISHKHGGFFRVQIQAIDFADEIMPHTSDRLIIHSDKVLAKKIRSGKQQRSGSSTFGY